MFKKKNVFREFEVSITVGETKFQYNLVVVPWFSSVTPLCRELKLYFIQTKINQDIYREDCFF